MSESASYLPDFLNDSNCQCVQEILTSYPISIITCCYWRNHTPWSLPVRIRVNSQFFFPIEGKLRVHMDNKTTIVSPGEFIMIRENRRHVLSIVKGCARLHQFVLHCNIHDRWGRPLLSRFSTHKGRLPHTPSWTEMLQELTCLMEKRPETGQRFGESIIQILLAWQLNHGMKMSSAPSVGDPRVGLALQTMENEFASPHLSVESLARAVGITGAHLLRLFRRETGTSPKQYLGTLRLRKASRLLCHSMESIKEIAASCGFPNEQYFYFIFRKTQGFTPSEYRRRLTENS